MGSRFSRFDNKIKDILNKDSEIKNFEVIDKIFKSENIKYNRGDSKAFSKYLTRFRKRFTENYDATNSLNTPIFSNKKSLAIYPYLNGNPDNILVIGDLHAPFTLPKYLKFCREQQEIYKCGTVIFIGDIIDNHYSSYHESDPDGHSAGEELDRSIDMIADWYHTFPKATVIIGNHDRLVYRKAYTAGVSKRWIKEYKDVLGTAGWDFVESIELFDINFNHGEGGTARNRIKSELQSQVQGHLHTQLYTDYLVGANFIVWGMQVGCGVDNKSYAMAYGRHYRKPAIGCGVVINKGTLPIAIPMKMG